MLPWRINSQRYLGPIADYGNQSKEERYAEHPVCCVNSNQHYARRERKRERCLSAITGSDQRLLRMGTVKQLTMTQRAIVHMLALRQDTVLGRKGPTIVRATAADARQLHSILTRDP